MSTKPTIKQIDEYLALFEGDARDAMAAIKERVQPETELVKRIPYIAAPRSDSVIISTRALTKTYKIGKQHINALDNVTLDIYKGEIVALTGASGSGKSTLLQLIGGLDTATGGSIIIDTVRLNKMSDRELSRFRNRTIGFVFQFFYLQPFLRLGRNLEVAGMPLRTKRKARQLRIRELADAVGLGERLRFFPKELSGGQMQRASIARALLNNPKILLADEPTGNLDSVNSSAIIDLFEQIRKEFGTTIIIVTHDPSIARRADRIITLKDGVII